VVESVPNVEFRGLLQACERLGLDVDALARSMGLDQQLLADPDATFSRDTLLALWDTSTDLSGDEHVALRIARAIPEGANAVLDYLVANAPTIGNAFARFEEYSGRTEASVQFTVNKVGEQYTVGIHPTPQARSALAAAEFAFAHCLLKVRDLTHQYFVPLRIEFASARPRHAVSIADFFGCPITFNQDRNRMWFDRCVWALPSMQSGPSLLCLLEQQPKFPSHKPSPEPAFVTEVRRVFYDGGPTLSAFQVAKRLGLSRQALQTELDVLGQELSVIASAVREDLAHRLLSESSVSIAETALLLGFGDTCTFSDSFEAWTGHAPTAYRAARISRPAPEHAPMEGRPDTQVEALA
jgi:AraC-like DNA-binding protein